MGKVKGQADKPLPIASVVKLDFVRGVVIDNEPVPYDIPLLFTGDLPDEPGMDEVKKLYMFYKPEGCNSRDVDREKNILDVDKSIGNLKSKYTYLGEWGRKTKTLFGTPATVEFSFIGRDPSVRCEDPKDPKCRQQNFLVHDQLYCLAIRESKKPDDIDKGQQFISIRTPSTFADHFKLDFGLGLATHPQGQALVGTVSLHGYIVPINESTDLGTYMPFGKHVKLRTSLFIALVPLTIHSWGKQDIKQIASVGNLAVGIGIRSPLYGPHLFNSNTARRFLQPMRFNIGAMYFAQANANPIIPTDTYKWSPFVGITYDFNIAAVFGPVAKLFGSL